MKNISLKDLKPYVRYSRELVISSNTEYFGIVAYDNRLFMCLDGNGSITVNGTAYHMEKGSLILWRAGFSYSYSSDSINPMKLIGLNFDFTWDYSQLTSPIPPDDTDIFLKDKILENIYFTDVESFNSVFYIKNMYHAKMLLNEINNEFTNKYRYYESVCSCKLFELLTILVRFYTISKVMSKKNIQADIIISYIQKNCHENLSNINLGKIFGYHPIYINRIIKTATGLSVHQYLLNCRIDKAIELLQSSYANISETAHLCGFRDISRFSKVFKEKTGYPPSKFKT